MLRLLRPWAAAPLLCLPAACVPATAPDLALWATPFCIRTIADVQCITNPQALNDSARPVADPFGLLAVPVWFWPYAWSPPPPAPPTPILSLSF